MALTLQTRIHALTHLARSQRPPEGRPGIIGC